MSLLQWPNGYWYYRLPGMKGYKSTGTRDHREAVLFTQEKMKSAELPMPRRAPLLKEYSADFFIWDRCPHCRKLRDEGKQITKLHAYNQRRLLEKYVLTDTIADKSLEELTRAEVIDFRGRLAEQLGSKLTTANKALGVLKTILKEAFYREDLQRDPAALVGKLKTAKKEAGIFTPEELRALFPLEGLGPWKTILDKTCFLIAASTGMRRGEILALRWKHIDFKKSIVKIEEAWKSHVETGTPKWGKKRTVILPPTAAAALTDFWERLPRQLAGAESLIFCYVDGSRLGETWWSKHFASAMKEAKIDTRARGIKPHSFRHTVATLRRDAGEDPAKIRAALGWSSEQVQGGYEHFTPEMLRSSVIDQIWSKTT